MSKILIYHNPKCSKSREALNILNESGEETEVIEYLKTPPDASAIEKILDMLGCDPLDIMRTKEADFRELGLHEDGVTREQLIEAMVARPILIERPIVVKDNRVVLGRPPEKVRELL
ncbi:MAG: arsenate reductase (glutaredoxin) [Spirochaetales bacterium]|jgi:arsenate reductase (glutaredoxin)|nr:arsenate reductase (glutaredoxin) [Spirochaetales bacterium]